jgi:hypothetical protein
VSRTWKRVGLHTICGGPCGRQLAPGDPVLAFRSVAWGKEEKIRCPQCAGEPMPDDIPALQSPTPITPTVRMPSLAESLPLDFKQRQTRDE